MKSTPWHKVGAAWWCLLAAWLAAMPCQARDQGTPKPPLNIAAYASPDRRFQLTVYPSTKFTADPATYQLKRDGHLLWEQKLDFAMPQAIVTDRGEVAGFGEEGQGEAILILNPDGSQRAKLLLAREAERWPDLLAETRIKALLVDPDKDRLWVRVTASNEREPRPERVLAVSLAGGSALSALPLVPNDNVGQWYGPFLVRAVRGTGLLLVAWYLETQFVAGQTSRGLYLSLIDAAGRQFWGESSRGEFEDRTGIYDQLKNGLPLLPEEGLAPRQFVRLSLLGQEKVVYQVEELREKTPDGEIRLVFDVNDESEPATVETSTDGTQLVVGPPPIELHSLGVVRLAGGAKAGGTSLPAGFVVDAAGRIYLGDRRDGAVHVFRSNGKYRHTLRIPAKLRGTGGFVGEIAIDGRGWVYRKTNTPDLRYLAFDAQGRAAGLQPQVLDQPREVWRFRPGAQDRLLLGHSKARFVPGDGRPAIDLERRADEGWLNHVHDGAIAPDGSWVITTYQPKPAITFFDRDGIPRSTVNLPALSHPEVAYNGTLAFATDFRSGYLHLIDRHSGRIARAELPPRSGQTKLYPAVSPDGKEVWLLDGGARRVHRYAVPTMR